jgi:hypothetical protein
MRPIYSPGRGGTHPAAVSGRLACHAVDGASVLAPQQFRQLGEVRRHAAGLIPAEQLGRRAPAGLLLEVEIDERLPGGVLHDEARVVMLLDDPRRREAARGGRRGPLGAVYEPLLIIDEGVTGTSITEPFDAQLVDQSATIQGGGKRQTEGVKNDSTVASRVACRRVARW